MLGRVLSFDNTKKIRYGPVFEVLIVYWRRNISKRYMIIQQNKSCYKGRTKCLKYKKIVVGVAEDCVFYVFSGSGHH